MNTDFIEWIYRSGAATVRSNKALKVFAGPDVSEADFRRMCTEEAVKQRDKELETKTRTLETKIKTLMDKLGKEERELSEDQEEVSQRKMEEYGTHAENLFSLFSKRRRTLTTSLSKRRLTEKAKADVEESIDTIEQLKKDIEETKKEREEIAASIQKFWSDALQEVEELPVAPMKKDILVELFGVAWLPYMVVDTPSGPLELPGFDPGWEK